MHPQRGLLLEAKLSPQRRSACAWYTGSSGGSCRVSGTTRTGSLSCWGATQSSVEGCLSCPVPQLCPSLCCAWHVGVAQSLQESFIGPCCLQMFTWMALGDTYPPVGNCLDLPTGARRAVLSRVHGRGQVFGRERYACAGQHTCPSDEPFGGRRGSPAVGTSCRVQPTH